MTQVAPETVSATKWRHMHGYTMCLFLWGFRHLTCIALEFTRLKTCYISKCSIYIVLVFYSIKFLVLSPNTSLQATHRKMNQCSVTVVFSDSTLTRAAFPMPVVEPQAIHSVVQSGHLARSFVLQLCHHNNHPFIGYQRSHLFVSLILHLVRGPLFWFASQVWHHVPR